MNDLAVGKSALDIACLLLYARLNLPEASHRVSERSDAQGTDLVPGWDDQLHNSESSAYRSASMPGRSYFRGHAWGVSNPFNNFRYVVSGSFRHTFPINKDQIVGNSEYKFRVRVRTAGRFLHFASGTSSSDSRTPPAQTNGQVYTQITAYETDPNGTVRSTIAGSGRIMHVNTTVNAIDRREVRTSLDMHLELVFTPSGNYPVVISVRHSVVGAARGKFSDCQVTGTSDGPPRWRTTVSSATVQKVLHASDPCYAILNAP